MSAPTLRPYQSKAVAEVLAHLQRGAEGVLLESPVGSGKTTMGMEIVDRVIGAGQRVAWFTHRQELRDQAAARADLYDLAYGIIAPGEEVTSARLHVASIDTVTARLQALRPWLASLDLAVFDEAHHIAAGGWDRIAAAMPRARKLGLTATPYRLDGKGLGEGGHFTATVRTLSIAELTEAGFLAPALVYAPPSSLDLSRVAKRGGDFALGEMARAVEAAGLSVLGRRWYAAHCPGEPAVVFCPTVELAEASAEAYRAAGWLATSVDGSMSARERAAAIGGLADGSVQVLTSCALIGEGLDIPAIACAILERPTASTSLYVQMVGRALRPHPGKTHAVVLDLVGNCSRHGMYDAKRAWDLKGGLRGLEKAVAAVWRCRQCHRVQGRPDESTVMRCDCGHTQTVKGWQPPAIEAHPPIAGIPADYLLSMKWKDAVKACKTHADLVMFFRLYGQVHPGKCQNPEAMARMHMDQRNAWKTRSFRAGGWR
ncbi:MAG: hypothetical protein RLZZ501_1212 [Pseudomonadota bacterium]|jgi:superfamily II DNA or RNA helicase